MSTAVDTNVLVDIQRGDPTHFAASAQALEEAASQGPLIVGEVVYAELSTRLPKTDLDRFLGDLGIACVASSSDALHRAGQVYDAYLRSRGPEVQCPSCGHRLSVACPNCGANVAWRQHLAPDFLVGAHAELHSGRLLTRDRGLYGRFFPGVVKT